MTSDDQTSVDCTKHCTDTLTIVRPKSSSLCTGWPTVR